MSIPFAPELDGGPLYAVIDVTRNPQLYELMQEIGAGCLYSGEAYLRLRRYAPWCAQYSPRLQQAWEAEGGQGWREHWGWHMQSPLPFAQLLLHLKKFNQVTLPDGKTVYWRYYDPRVFASTLQVLQQQQLEDFFGNTLHALYCHAADKRVMYKIARSAGLCRVSQQTFSLPLPQNAA